MRVLKLTALSSCLFGVTACHLPATPDHAAPTGSPAAAQTRVAILPFTAGEPIDKRRPEKSDDHPAFPGQTRAPYVPSRPPVVTVLTTQLHSPWSVAFLPDGRMLVTEKPGAMRLVSPDGTVSAPLQGVPPVSAIGQVGLLDVALDPQHAASRRIFFSYSEPTDADRTRIVVARAELNAAQNGLEHVEVIFRAKPDLPRTQSANSGGRIAVDRRGNLFVTIGDRSQSPPWDAAQRLDTHLGKIIHITPDGHPSPDNPYLNTPAALPEIWSSGHRSEEGLTIHPVSGELWESEHGPRGGDEINKPQAGRNYGWPVIVHGIDYPGTQIGAGITEQAGMEQPLYYWDPVIAPSGLAFYNGAMFPAWKGNLFVGALRGTMLDRLVLSGDAVIGEEPLLLDRHARIRDVREGPEGALYVLTDDGKLLKLTPQ